ncbi:MAG: hypothetical protein IT184_15065 [Acidobacteria bacterium]|nr:hypothetical protein [Acidobacteriota bacterium]
MLPVDGITLELIARTLPRLSLAVPHNLKSIRAHQETSALVFEMDDGFLVTVPVSEDRDHYCFELPGGHVAVMAKEQILGRAH